MILLSGVRILMLIENADLNPDPVEMKYTKIKVES
jgi:hypothetical protein